MRAAILAILFLMGCHKPETCDLYVFASHSMEEGVHTVSNKNIKWWTGVSPETCTEEAERRRSKMKGVYLWYNNEMEYDELVFCKCKN